MPKIIELPELKTPILVHSDHEKISVLFCVSDCLSRVFPGGKNPKFGPSGDEPGGYYYHQISYFLSRG
jgi:hypothetical protein